MIGVEGSVCGAEVDGLSSQLCMVPSTISEVRVTTCAFFLFDGAFECSAPTEGWRQRPLCYCDGSLGKGVADRAACWSVKTGQVWYCLRGQGVLLCGFRGFPQPPPELGRKLVKHGWTVGGCWPVAFRFE